jgi:hypothetical protein
MNPREQHERAAPVDLRRKVLSQHGGADDLGVEGLQQVLTLQVLQLSAGAGRRRGHHMIQPADPAGERGDRLVVGDVKGFDADVGVVIGSGEFRFIASCDDDACTL